MTWVGVGRSSFVPVYRLTFLNECCFTEVRVVSLIHFYFIRKIVEAIYDQKVR